LNVSDFIVFLAKSVAATDEFREHLKNPGQIRKVYFARVVGKIDVQALDKDIIVEEDDTFLVDKDLYTLKNSSYCTCDPNECESEQNGKNAQTKFEVLFYDIKSNTSVLK